MAKKPSSSSRSRSKRTLPAGIWIVLAASITGLLGLAGVLITNHAQFIAPLRVTQTFEAKLTQLAPLATPTSDTAITHTDTPVSSSTATLPPPPTETETTIPIETQAQTDTPTPTMTPTVDVERSCDSFPPPCTYRVRGGDYYRLIAFKFYGNADLATMIANLNRNSDGTIQKLYTETMLLIPALDSIPPLPYSECGLGTFPCQYRAYQGDTYTWIAQRFYRDTAYTNAIEQANPDYSKLPDYPPVEIMDGTVIVVPVKPSSP